LQGIKLRIHPYSGSLPGDLPKVGVEPTRGANLVWLAPTALLQDDQSQPDVIGSNTPYSGGAYPALLRHIGKHPSPNLQQMNK